MVYRGRSGADPEKKGEDVFPIFLVCTVLALLGTDEVWAGPVSVPIFADWHRTHLDKGYSPTDVLWLVPSPQMC